MKRFWKYGEGFAATKPSPIHRRYLSTPRLPPPPPPKGYVRLTTRRLISLRGRDASHFLQGLTTRNIPSVTSSADLQSTQGFYSAFLNASGRVLHDVFIYPDRRLKGQDDVGFLIEVDAEEVQTLARHLKRYKLRAKVTVEIVDDGEVQVWSAWDNDSTLGDILGEGTLSHCDDQRVEGMGKRLVLPGATKPSMDAEMVDIGVYEVRRMLKGVAEGQMEILKESALPLESNMDYTGGIDFRKGCYVGQELTIRTYHTGVVRKRILPVQLYNSDSAPQTLNYDPASDIVAPPKETKIQKSNGKGRSTGKWLGGVGNIGLALCRLENMTDIVLTGESNQWNPDDEFILSWPEAGGRAGGEVRIKAFVPDWHRNRISIRDTHREGNIAS